jgi:hypothetical protein
MMAQEPRPHVAGGSSCAIHIVNFLGTYHVKPSSPRRLLAQIVSSFYYSLPCFFVHKVPFFVTVMHLEPAPLSKMTIEFQDMQEKANRICHICWAEKIKKLLLL